MFGFGRRKKEEDVDVPFPDSGEGRFPPPEDAFSAPQAEAPSFPSFPSMQEPPRRRDDAVVRPVEPPSLTGDKMEVLIAKIESLKSMIEVLNQRLISIETRLFHQERKW